LSLFAWHKQSGGSQHLLKYQNAQFVLLGTAFEVVKLLFKDFFFFSVSLQYMIKITGCKKYCQAHLYEIS